MPVALETSKRKFQKLLDSLTSTTSPNPPTNKSTTDPSDPASKRARLSPRTRLTSSHPLVNSSTNIRRIPRAQSSHSAAVPASSSAAETEEDAKPEDLPNYTPWSTPAFLARLQTFADVSRWSEKPAAIDEVAWAKRGWVLDPTGKDKVACKGGCEERVVISLGSYQRNDEQEQEQETREGDKEEASEDDDENNNAVASELTKRYADLLATGHADGCAWRERGCGDQVMRMPLARTTVWQDGLLKRYKGFVVDGMQGRLPPIGRLTWPTELDVEAVAASLTADFMATAKDDDVRVVTAQVSATPTQEDGNSEVDQSMTEPPGAVDTSPQLNPQPINITALTFALLGWQCPPPSSTNPALNLYPTATCTQCFRRLGLWLYTSSNAPTYPNEELPEAHPDRLDLTASHRSYCPWVSADSQSNPPGGALQDLNGWQTLRKVVGNWAGLQERARRRRLGDEEAARLESVAGRADLEGVDGDRDGSDGGDGESEMRVESEPSPARSREEVRREDNARFKRLRDLTRAMGFRKRPGRGVGTSSVG